MRLGRKRRTNYNGVIRVRFLEAVVQNWRLLFLFLMFAAGMACGASIIKDGDSFLTSKLVEVFESYHAIRSVQSIAATFGNTLFASTLFILSGYIFGLCAVGIPIISALPFLKGLGLGMVTGWLYSTFALKGLAYSLLIIYPGSLVAILALLLGCNESLMTSYDIFLSISNRSDKADGGGIRLYNARFIIFFLITTAGALLETVFSKAFSSFFKF